MIKRVIDFLVALMGLLALSPVLVTIAVWIKLSSRGPVLYRGVRIGKYGIPFRILKFRTMVVNAENMGASSSPEDDPRITSAGRFLRRHKLDELPQLFNVVMGDMSLVGPRPQVEWAVQRYTQDQKQLLTVRPGVTDYASIKFHNEGEILRGSADPDKDYLEKIEPEKIRLGLEYVRSRDFWVDTQIILATLWRLMGGDPEKVLTIPKSPGCFASTSHHREAIGGRKNAQN